MTNGQKKLQRQIERRLPSCLSLRKSVGQKAAKHGPYHIVKKWGGKEKIKYDQIFNLEELAKWDLDLFLWGNGDFKKGIEIRIASIDFALGNTGGGFTKEGWNKPALLASDRKKLEEMKNSIDKIPFKQIY